MKKKHKIGIWGQFGGKGQIADGQAVRTTIITEEVKLRYGENNVFTLNTNGWKRRPLSFLFDTINLLRRCRNVVIFPAENGFKVIVPLYNMLNRIFKKELYYVVIGGFLPGLLEKNLKYVKKLKKYKALLVQTKGLQVELEAFGLENVHILSNLKRLELRKSSDITINCKENIKVCTFSRVTKAKGIDEAFTAIKKANEKLGNTRIFLDIYGIIDPEYKKYFDELLQENKEFANYKGVVDYDKTVEVLKNYFLLLFPTTYYGEGFPGNVIDAYSVGLPIIATDWKYNGEIVNDGTNGYLVKINSPEEICEAVLKLYKDREHHYQIGINNLKEIRKYHPDLVLKDFFRLLDNAI